MTVRVLLFARARELAGAGAVTLDLPAAATVADLRAALSAAYPALAGVVARSAVAVNEEFADNDVAVAAGAAVAIIPPVSGGAG